MNREGGFTKGRDRSFHFGTMEHNIVGIFFIEFFNFVIPGLAIIFL